MKIFRKKVVDNFSTFDGFPRVLHTVFPVHKLEFLSQINVLRIHILWLQQIYPQFVVRGRIDSLHLV